MKRPVFTHISYMSDTQKRKKERIVEEFMQTDEIS